jgi:hypothetical protein
MDLLRWVQKDPQDQLSFNITKDDYPECREEKSDDSLQGFTLALCGGIFM